LGGTKRSFRSGALGKVAPLKTLFTLFVAVVVAASVRADDGAYETDRPGEVENPYTLKPGRTELVTYAVAMNAAARNDQFGEGGSAVVLDTAVRAGLASGLEVAATVDTFLQASPPDSDDGAATGLGYATLLAKWNFLKSASDDYGLALVPFVRVPINRHISQTSRAASGLILPFNIDLEGGWELEGSTSVAHSPGDRGSWATTCEGQVSLQRSLTSRLSAYAELQLEAGESLPAWSAEGGITLRLNPSALLDIGGSLGIGKNSRGRMGYAGLGWRF
jgi:hypothetical protein